jgi:hypothetical protein
MCSEHSENITSIVLNTETSVLNEQILMILGKSCIIIKSSYLAHLSDWQMANQMTFYMGWGPSQEDTVDQVVKILQLVSNMMVDYSVHKCSLEAPS